MLGDGASTLRADGCIYGCQLREVGGWLDGVSGSEAEQQHRYLCL